MRAVRLFIWIASALVMAACGNQVSEDNYYVIDGVSLASESRVMAVGDTAVMKAILHPYEIVLTDDVIWAKDLAGSVFWKSDNERVAVVDAKGVVTAVGPGSCTVSVICGLYKGSCKVVVRQFDMEKLYGLWELSGDSILVDFNGDCYLNGYRCSLDFDGMRFSLLDGTDILFKMNLVSVADNTVEYMLESDEKEICHLMERAAYSLTAEELLDKAVAVASGNDSLVMAVNMELSVNILWAVANLGASSAENAGLHFSWAETKTKSKYILDAYKWYNAKTGDLTKYTDCKVPYGYNLESGDDAAEVLLGEGWSVPTGADVKALLSECGMMWACLNDVEGVLYVNRRLGIGGPKLFLPLKGTYYGESKKNNGSYISGAYWTSSYSAQNASLANYLGLTLTNSRIEGEMGETYRYNGISIRPVYNNQ